MCHFSFARIRGGTSKLQKQLTVTTPREARGGKRKRRGILIPLLMGVL